MQTIPKLNSKVHKPKFIFYDPAHSGFVADNMKPSWTRTLTTASESK